MSIFDSMEQKIVINNIYPLKPFLAKGSILLILNKVYSTLHLLNGCFYIFFE